MTEIELLYERIKILERESERVPTLWERLLYNAKIEVIPIHMWIKSKL